MVCVSAAVPAIRPGDPPLAVSFTLLAPRASARTLTRLAADLRTMVEAMSDGLGRVPWTGGGAVSATRRPELSRIGLGCASLGNLYEAMSDDDATAVVDAAWDAGIRYFDTAPLYGHGLSEQRVGRALGAPAARRVRRVDQGRAPAAPH